MNQIVEEVGKELEELKKMRKVVAEFQRHEPEGCLKYQKKEGKVYFYHQQQDEQSRRWVRKYIKKENTSLARDLAQKQYYMMIRPVLERNIDALQRLVDQYHPDKIEEIYQKLSEERKGLITPFPIEREEKIRQWQEEKYEINTSFAENLRYETEQGEMVRSKSEVIIANILYRHRLDISYKYERPLDVVVGKRIRTIYPDFTILNLRTGKILYWEHAGKMDDPEYADDFVRKVNTYISNDLLPGRDVVFSYESISNPLEIGVIRKMVEEVVG